MALYTDPRLSSSTSPTTATTATTYGNSQTSAAGVNFSDAELQSAATATGVDLFLSQGAGVDFATYNAEVTADLQNAGYNPTQLQNTLTNIKKAYDQAVTDDQAGRGAKTFTNTDKTQQVGYDQFVRQVGSEVLPANAGEPKYLAPILSADDEKKVTNWGQTDAKNLQPGQNFQTVLNTNSAQLRNEGLSDHAIALYRTQFLDTYYASQQKQPTASSASTSH